MDPISIAGLALSGAGLVNNMLSGGSAERERQARMQRLLQQIAQQRASTLAAGSREIVKGTESSAGVARQAAARRAAAAGVSGANAESYVLPGESNAYNRGTDALENFTTETNRTFDRAALNAEADFADRPIAPDASDYLMEIGSGALKFGQDREYLDAMNSLNAPNPQAPGVPVASTQPVQPAQFPAPNGPLTEKTFGYVPQSGFNTRRTDTTTPTDPLNSLSWVQKYRNALRRGGN